MVKIVLSRRRKVADEHRISAPMSSSIASLVAARNVAEAVRREERG